MRILFMVLLWLIIAGVGLAQPPRSAYDAVSSQDINSSDDSIPKASGASENTSGDSASVSDVSGTLLERGNRNPLSNVTFYIQPNNHVVTTDEKGRFRLQLPPGVYHVVISAAGYDKFESTVTVTPNTPLRLSYRLLPETMDSYQIVVKSKKEKVAVSSKKITVQEATRIPGNNRDVLGVVANLPGVVSVSSFGDYNSGIIIRGSEQEDSRFYVNGHTVPMLYHFGGLESLFEPELVDTVTFDAGGFSAEFNDATGGVVAMTLRDPRTDRIGGYANLGMLSSSFMVEGPINEADSFAVCMKKGFIDTYVRTALDMQDDQQYVSFAEYPNYYDGTAIFKHDFSERNTFTLTGMGASNALEAISADEMVSSRFSSSRMGKVTFFNIIGEWRYRNGNLRSLFSVMAGKQSTELDFGPRANFKYHDNQYRLSEKMTYQLSDVHLLSGGAYLILDTARLTSKLWSDRKEGEIFRNPYQNEVDADMKESAFIPSVYFMDQMVFGNLTVIPGCNVLYDDHNVYTYFDPRLTVTYHLNEALTFKAATGLYSKLPQRDENYEPWGTEGLKPERSIHLVGGVEHFVNDAISMEIQLYHKTFYDSIVRVDVNDPTVYDNKGEGEAYGAEFFLRHSMTDSFFGWLSYSYGVSKRKDADGVKRSFDWDVPHSLKAVASYKPNRLWTFGVKYTYASGSSYTDLLNVDTIYDVDNDIYIPLYFGPVNEDRLDCYHQVDFRIDKAWLFEDITLSTYLDVRNILQNNHVVGVRYNADYTESEDVEAISSIVPLIFLGVKVEF